MRNLWQFSCKTARLKIPTWLLPKLSLSSELWLCSRVTRGHWYVIGGSLRELKFSSRHFYTWGYQLQCDEGLSSCTNPLRTQGEGTPVPWNILLDNSWTSIVHIKHDRRKPLLRSLGLDMFTSFPSLSEENNSTSTTSPMKKRCLLCRIIGRITWVSHSFSTHIL